jgi:cytoskeletal protein RodZ
MGDFGGKLRQARERRGVSLRQISSATKISVGVLEALERNDVSKLPGGIFSRAFVRSYASEVGLDPDETIRDFVSEFSSEEAPVVHSPVPAAQPAAPRTSETGRPAPKPAPQPARRIQPSVEIVPDESEFESQQRMASVVLRLVMVSVPIVLVILYFSLRGPAPAADASRSQRPAPEAAPPPTTAPLDPSAPVGAATTGRETPSAVALPPPPIPSQSAGEQTIELRPGAPCWVSLTVDGAPSFTREMQAGERVVRTFREEAVLKVGDGAACEFALNGRIARPLGGPGQARTIKITPQNASSYLP